MRIRNLGPCREYSHWRDADSITLAGTPAPKGECRRRVQTGEDGLRPRQPGTHPTAECSEHMPTPGPERLARCCGDCRYWRAPETERISSADEGLCRVWAPRWSGTEPGHAFPITRRDFYCGDGMSLTTRFKRIGRSALRVIAHHVM